MSAWQVLLILFLIISLIMMVVNKQSSNSVSAQPVAKAIDIKAANNSHIELTPTGEFYDLNNIEEPATGTVPDADPKDNEINIEATSGPLPPEASAPSSVPAEASASSSVPAEASAPGPVPAEASASSSSQQV